MTNHSWPFARGYPFVAAGFILAAAASRLATLPVHVGLDPNEGWNAFQTVRAMGAGPLYPAADTMIGNNYPPLSFFVVGWLSKLVGDPIIAGRLLALASVIGIAGVLVAILRRFRVSARVAVGAGGLFLLLNATILRSYLAMDDPQWFGHLIMMASVLTLLPVEQDQAPRPAHVVGAAILVLVGGLVKQNLVAWPLAMTAWLAWHHRGSLIAWLATLILGGGTALALCRIGFGPDFLPNIAGAARHYSIDRMVSHALIPLLLTIPALAYCRPLIEARKTDTRIDLILVAVIIAVPLGVIQRSGAGVDINAHFEAAIALCLACPLAAAGARQRGRARLALMAVTGLLVAGVALEVIDIVQMSAKQHAWKAMQQRIAALPGPVACETQALCFWAGKSFEIDFFLYGERVRANGDARLLDHALSERRFAAIQLDRARPSLASASSDDDTLTQRIRRRMKPAFIDGRGRQLLVPQ